jgi:hypothetical protein
VHGFVGLPRLSTAHDPAARGALVAGFVVGLMLVMLGHGGSTADLSNNPLSRRLVAVDVAAAGTGHN